MRVLRRVLVVLLVLVVAAAVGGYWYARPLVATGTGYAAHNACAVTFVAGRGDPEADLPPNPLVPYLTGYLNRAGRSSTAAALWVLSKRKAWYVPGYGCTVAAERPADPGRATKVANDPNPLSDDPAPAADPAVDALVGTAFGDGRSAAARRAL